MDKEEIKYILIHDNQFTEEEVNNMSNFEMLDNYMTGEGIGAWSDDIWNICLCLIKDEIVNKE